MARVRSVAYRVVTSHLFFDAHIARNIVGIVYANTTDVTSVLKDLHVSVLPTVEDDGVPSRGAIKEHETNFSVQLMVVGSDARRMGAINQPWAVLVCAPLTVVVAVVLSMGVTSRHNHPLNIASNMAEERNAATRDVKRLPADVRSTVQL